MSVKMVDVKEFISLMVEDVVSDMCLAGGEDTVEVFENYIKMLESEKVEEKFENEIFEQSDEYVMNTIMMYEGFLGNSEFAMLCEAGEAIAAGATNKKSFKDAMKDGMAHGKEYVLGKVASAKNKLGQWKTALGNSKFAQAVQRGVAKAKNFAGNIARRVAAGGVGMAAKFHANRAAAAAKKGDIKKHAKHFVRGFELKRKENSIRGRIKK